VKTVATFTSISFACLCTSANRRTNRLPSVFRVHGIGRDKYSLLTKCVSTVVLSVSRCPYGCATVTVLYPCCSQSRLSMMLCQCFAVALSVSDTLSHCQCHSVTVTVTQLRLVSRCHCQCHAVTVSITLSLKVLRCQCLAAVTVKVRLSLSQRHIVNVNRV
jgi:hypothetical protein